MIPYIKEEETENRIATKDITEKHLVVAVINGDPRILGKSYSESMRNLIFFTLRNPHGEIITMGNGVAMGDASSAKEMVEKAMGLGVKVAVFEQKDWKQALQWLMDNVE